MKNEEFRKEKRVENPHLGRHPILKLMITVSFDRHFSAKIIFSEGIQCKERVRIKVEVLFKYENGFEEKTQ